MASKNKKKTFHIKTLCYYPCDIFIPAENKKEAIEILNDKDRWHLVETEHRIEEHQYDTFYVEDIKEFKGRRDRKRKNHLTEKEISGVYSENSEGLKDKIDEKY